MMYALIGAKLAVGFLCLLLYLNLSGRAQLAPNSAADQIGNYVLGGIIGGVIYNPAISILEMVIVIGIWAALILGMQLIKAHNRRAKQLIDGTSLLMYDGGRLMTDHLRLVHKSARDFIADMHMRGIHRLTDLQSVWLETNGQYTVLKAGETPFPLSLVEDGQIVRESLTRLGQDDAWLAGQLSAQGFADTSKIAYAEYYREGDQGEGQINIYPYQ